MYIDVYSHTSVPHKTPIVSFKNPTPGVLGARWSRCCVVKVPSERPWMPRYAKPWRWKRPKGWSRWRWNAHNGNNNRWNRLRGWVFGVFFFGGVDEVGDFFGVAFFLGGRRSYRCLTGSEFDFSEKTSASLQEELQKVLLERHKERLAERCVEQLAQLKEQLAEEQGVDALGEAERMSNNNSGQLQSW